MLAFAEPRPLTPVDVEGPEAGAEVDPTPEFHGTGDRDATIVFTGSDRDLGSATVARDGTWRFTPAAPLPEGDITVVATQDVDGSVDSVDLKVAVPAEPVAIASHNDGDDFTHGDILHGTGEPGAVVTIADAEAKPSMRSARAQVTVDVEGVWALALHELEEGERTVTVIQDVDGSSAAVKLAVRAPDTPGPVDPADGSKLGAGERGEANDAKG